MPSSFTDADEEELWNPDTKPISEITHSFSGHERNRLFISQAGKQFADVSLLSAVDSEADGRVFAATDFDRDGFSDLAVVNSNAPLFQFFHNQIGRRAIRQNQPTPAFIAVRLVGGNNAAAPSRSKWSNRDGVGARICVTTDTRKIYRDHQCGEGLAAQNSSTRIIGCGITKSIPSVVVTWPSGRKSEIPDAQLGELLTIYENPEQSPNGKSTVHEHYQPERPINESPTTSDIFARHDSQLPLSEFLGRDAAIGESTELVVITTMASWCQACVAHLPQFEVYEQQLTGRITMLGFPIDPTDTAEKLSQFETKHDVPYTICEPMPDDRRERFISVLRKHGDPDVLPSTVVTDKQGRVLLVENGVPSVSKLKSLIRQLHARSK